MTDSQPSTTQSEHLTVMEEMLHPRLVQALDGRIREVSREEIDAAIGRLRTEVTELITTQRDIRERAQSLPADQRREVQHEVDAASRQTDEARQATNDLQARRDAGEQIDEQEVDQVRRQSDQAAASQQRASQRVDTVSTTADQPEDRRLAAATRARQEHEAQQADRSTRSTSAPAPSRATDREVGGFVTQTQLTSELDQVYARINSVNDRATRAIAIARASASSVAPFRRATTWAMIAFVAVAVLYLLITGLTPIEHVWRDNFAWAFGVAFIAFCIGVITANDASADAEARSEAHTGHSDDDGLDLVQRRHDHDDQQVQYPGHARSPRATADAHASAR